MFIFKVNAILTKKFYQKCFIVKIINNENLHIQFVLFENYKFVA